ncbi:MAG: sulfatase-like hydrolase/transferase [Pseudomonadota bacterium]
MNQRPNILMVVTDQQRRDTVGAYGSTICRTPHVDSLARDGIRFDAAFTPTGLCSPVRCSLLTGVYPHEHRVLTNVGLHPVRAELSPEEDRLSQGLKATGYRLGYVGKWHVSRREPPAFGYEHYTSLGDFESWRNAARQPLHEAFSDYTVQRAETDPAPPEFSRPWFLAGRAIETIDALSDGDEPFFVRLDFHGPHFPNVVPEPYASMYDPAAIPPWPNHADTLDGKPAVQRIKQKHWRTENLPWSEWARLISMYFGEITLIDAAVGRVLGHLASNGLADDTLVIFTSDHGDTIGAHGICNKDYTMYEEIYLVPLILRWPGVIASGSSTNAYVHHFIDIFATLLTVAGAAVPEPCHGRSLLPILEGRGTPEDWPQSAFCEFHGSHMGLYSMRLLTTDDYAYIYHTNDIDELYDRRADPWQMSNLVDDPARADALADLKREMIAWMASTNDHLHNEWTVDWLSGGDPDLMAAAPGRKKTRW